ncbi:uncharacterized protein Triagg1_2106 [Trichoderma aggressivum f. europaeum]|uniref:Uncharacterized protein n=1 Tax=Trichoderma aggressivum f. europaeum TaxID=173218 RepID=A0AAE1IHJ4_9HYPO|nr:hypothetical protein Triagg1_2106 [Trichoderma aggressivum f. europaeum]
MVNKMILMAFMGIGASLVAATDQTVTVTTTKTETLHLDHVLDSIYFVHNGDRNGVQVYFHCIYHWLCFVRIKLFSIYVFHPIGDFKHQHDYWYNYEQHFHFVFHHYRSFHHHHRLEPTPRNHHVKLLSRVQLWIPHCKRKHRFVCSPKHFNFSIHVIFFFSAFHLAFNFNVQQRYYFQISHYDTSSTSETTAESTTLTTLKSTITQTVTVPGNSHSESYSHTPSDTTKSTSESSTQTFYSTVSESTGKSSTVSSTESTSTSTSTTTGQSSSGTSSNSSGQSSTASSTKTSSTSTGIISSKTSTSSASESSTTSSTESYQSTVYLEYLDKIHNHTIRNLVILLHFHICILILLIHTSRVHRLFSFTRHNHPLLHIHILQRLFHRHISHLHPNQLHNSNNNHRNRTFLSINISQHHFIHPPPLKHLHRFFRLGGNYFKNIKQPALFRSIQRNIHHVLFFIFILNFHFIFKFEHHLIRIHRRRRHPALSHFHHFPHHNHDQIIFEQRNIFNCFGFVYWLPSSAFVWTPVL